MNPSTHSNLSVNWDEELAQVRAAMYAAGGCAGLAQRADVMGLTGLQILYAQLAGQLPYPHIADTMDFALLQVEFGKAIFQGTPQTKHLNPMGTVHGGWYATLLDSAVGCAVQTTMPVGRGYTTAELSVNIVRGAALGGGPLRAIGTVIHSGRQLATAEGRIVGPDGRLYAHASTTCLVFERPATPEKSGA
jgi:uncharacterized protein (TIGR00369 family)